MPTKAYRLPDFLALLPNKPGGPINPHYKEAETAFNAWVKKKFNAYIAAELIRCEPPLGISVTFPLASYQQLKGIIDWSTAFCLLDDLIEKIPIDDVLALSKLWIRTLKDGTEVKRAGRSGIETICSELLLSVRPVVSSFHWPQFIAGNERMISQMIQEARDRKTYGKKSTPLDVQSYIIQRRSAIAAPLYFVVTRFTRSLEIPDDVLSNPAVQEIENCAMDMMVITNDVYSFKKEHGIDGAFSNILTVLHKNPETAHLDFQGRLDYAGKMFEATLERFHASRRKLPSFGPEVDGSLNLYLDGIIDVIVGNVQWSRVSGRYKVFVNKEDERDNVLRLTSDGSLGKVDLFWIANLIQTGFSDYFAYGFLFVLVILYCLSQFTFEGR